jgi:phage tail sheath protein FI
MPAALTYPGVYIEEIPSGVRTIVGVATSITAFVGRAVRGPVNDPVRIQSFSDYVRVFGGLAEMSTMSYAVQQFFLNGGTDALIVRVHLNGTKANLNLPTSAGSLMLEAASEGLWGNNLRATVDHNTKGNISPNTDADEFNLLIEELVPGSTTQVAQKESFLNVNRDASSPRFITTVLAQESKLVRVQGAVPSARPDPGTTNATANSGADGGSITDAQINPANPNKDGLFALEKADLFNLLCIPPLDPDTDIAASTRDAASKYCSDRRALFIADPPANWNDVTAAESGVSSFMTRSKNAAAFFPRIKMQDPLKENRLTTFAPCGAVAGVMARTDSTRGVWKAPAGLEATITGARELAVKMTDGENGRLNPLGLNSLRTFPVTGNVVWGSRTLDGADQLASEWKYIPVRRLALYIEESLFRGTQWVVFEPNDEPTWAQIRLNLGAFMQNLFRQGAFQGQSPRDAYFVKCDKETTTQDDINRGVVNIVVGFAPLKPAEFVVIKIQQIAGQVAA